VISQAACESDLGRSPAVTGTTAATGRCQWGARAVTNMEVRLAVLVLGHALMALYFMNPLSLMTGELWCTPYCDKPANQPLQPGLPVSTAWRAS
jgi:hypothetical protein